jgi:N-acetylglucosamine-6-phosphate deacetylase
VDILKQRVWLTGGRLSGQPDPLNFFIEEGRITDIRATPPPPDSETTILDLGGDWLSLGGIDLQINGALGLPFPDLQSHHLTKLAEICELLWQQGVDGFLPTLVTCAIEQVHAALAMIADYQASPAAHQPGRAAILGVHLEGPFLNPTKRGAHPQAFLQPLNLETVKTVLGDYTALVKVVTLAPELDPSGETIAYLQHHGIIVSLGHSLATAAEAQQAFTQGATMVTHAFNAMPALHHREPGLLGAALIHPQVWCGFIADGEHVCPTMLELLIRTQKSGTAGLFLVSDALSPLGLTDGSYPWDSRTIHIQQGTARLEDGTLAGTTLSLLTGVQNLVKWQCCHPEIAIALATSYPRHAIGQTDLAKGTHASHLLRWQQSPTGDLTWQRVFA